MLNYKCECSSDILNMFAMLHFYPMDFHCKSIIGNFFFFFLHLMEIAIVLDFRLLGFVIIDDIIDTHN